MTEKITKLISEAVFDYTILFEGGVTVEELYGRLDYVINEIIKPTLKEGEFVQFKTKPVHKNLKTIRKAPLKPVMMQVWRLETDEEHERRIKQGTTFRRLHEEKRKNKQDKL